MVKVQQVGRREVQGGEDSFLQGPGPDFGGLDADQGLGGAPVAHLEVGKAILQGDHRVVEHPLVGVIDQLGLPKRPGVYDAAVEMDVLPHHLGHVGVAQPFQDAGPQLGVVVKGPQARGFPQVVEEGAGRNQRQKQVKAGLRQGLSQKDGPPP